MALTPGTRLGSYEITAQIGIGGMGEVYRATDTKLKRAVAIKVLPAAVAGDAERLARFQREAEVLASLNHPNIAAIHGLEESDGRIALVMELVEGPTLADRIANGAIPINEALPIAKQIADALEAAHEQGIIHRDLKPANIKVRDHGTVKVLDFGLAKAITQDPGPSTQDLSQSPTITTPAMTQMGMVLGTAAYMSPEQAKGRAVDARTDVWAFGCVLFEMLTGRMAFEGDDVSEVFAGVIKLEPRWDALPADLPRSLRTFVRRCLQKDPKQRVHSIADVRLALDGAFENGASGPTPATVAQPLWRRGASSAASLAVGGLVVGLVAWTLWPRTEPLPVNRFEEDVTTDQAFRRTLRSVLAVSPDGRAFVYNTGNGLYLRRMEEPEARLIQGTQENTSLPFFAPDGQSIGYWAAETGQLKRIAINGGTAVAIGPATNPYGVHWEADGTILFGQPEGILRIAAAGGGAELVVPSQAGEHLSDPRLLPGGDAVLFTVSTGRRDTADIVVQSLSTGDRTVVVEGGGDARYLPTGHLVYVQGSDLLGVAFDPDRLTVTGGAVPLATGLAVITNVAGAANYGVSDDGTLVYVSGDPVGAAADRRLVWVDRQGIEVPTAVPARPYRSLSLSPDGTRAAVQIATSTGGDDDVWVSDLARGTLTRVTTDQADNARPLWSPDGRRVAFTSLKNGAPGVLWQAADGGGAAEPLLTMDPPAEQFTAWSWSPDGSRLFVTANLSVGDDVGTVAVGSPDAWKPLIQGTADEFQPALSPDGHWLAYTSNETGRDEVYVQRFPELEDRQLISVNGGMRPTWSADDELIYLQTSWGPPEAVMRVPLDIQNGPSPTLRPGTPERLFDYRYYSSQGGRREYDVSPDGRRFLLIADAGANLAPPRIIIVQHWFEELKRLVPTGN